MTVLNNYADIADQIPAMGLSLVTEHFLVLQDLCNASYPGIFAAVFKRVQEDTDFFEAPASTKFHLNCRNGLLFHSIGVTYRLLSSDAVYNFLPEYPMLDIILSGMLHDLGKAGQVDCGNKIYRKIPYYLVVPMKTKAGIKYERNDDLVAMSIPMGSLHYIATRLSEIWKPSLDVWQAIGYHDGQYVPEGEWVRHSEKKLMLALHHADMYQSRVERRWLNG